MVRGPGAICAVVANVVFAATALAAPGVPSGIETGLAAVRAAALTKSSGAEAVFADDLSLISQSGKLYARADALADLRGGFEIWENRDVVVRAIGGGAVVTLINRRKRTSMDAAEFRVMQVWQKLAGRWRLVAQSSTKVAA